jgi:hypothetical protein
VSTIIPVFVHDHVCNSCYIAHIVFILKCSDLVLRLSRETGTLNA